MCVCFKMQAKLQLPDNQMEALMKQQKMVYREIQETAGVGSNWGGKMFLEFYVGIFGVAAEN